VVNYKGNNTGCVAKNSSFDKTCPVCVCVCVCPPTIEEVALALEYLADLKGPDLTHPGVGGVKHEGLHGAVGRPRSEDELTGVALQILLHPQAADLEPEGEAVLYMCVSTRPL